MLTPTWFGRRYPRLADLEDFAWENRAVVELGPIPSGGLVLVAAPGFHTICLPAGLSPLDHIWQLAHELGHLVQHSGYTTAWAHDKQEAQANRWAARALIPEARVRAYKNACEDSFIAALSRHFEDIPLEDCPTRRLAGTIARYRLRALEEVA